MPFQTFGEEREKKTERERKKEGCFYYNRVTCFPQKLLCSFFNTHNQKLFSIIEKEE
jgi:hypothetical protein